MSSVPIAATAAEAGHAFRSPPRTVGTSSSARIPATCRACARRTSGRVDVLGFDPATAHLYPDGVIIVKDAHGFALALGHDTGLVRAPGFPHFGFETVAPDVVRDLRARLIADGVELVEDEDEDDYVGIKCLDPDGHVVEVSWEPQ